MRRKTLKKNVSVDYLTLKSGFCSSSSSFS